MPPPQLILEMRTITITISDGVLDGEQAIDVASVTIPSDFIITNHIISQMHFAMHQHIEREQIEGAYPNVVGLCAELQEIFGPLATVEEMWLEEDMADDDLEEFLEMEMHLELVMTIDDTDFWRHLILDGGDSEVIITDYLHGIGWM
jgi:hypothetical protein